MINDNLTLTEFVAYLIENKGFVVIDDKVHRYCNCSKEVFPYHLEDIGYKWKRYNKSVLTEDMLNEILIKLDISLRDKSEYLLLMNSLQVTRN